MPESRVHLFGIRHHGPGSARSLHTALTALQPDCVLVEGVPDADSLLPFVLRPELRPPIALLVYDPNLPKRSVFYPFAVFSPEWVAIRHALTHAIPVQFMDLPAANRLALLDMLHAEAPTDAEPDPSPPTDIPQSEDTPTPDTTDEASAPEGTRATAPNEPPQPFDPLGLLAQIAGFNDGESWWDHVVESRRAGDNDVFSAIHEAMTALREASPMEDPVEQLRESAMRQVIRAALKKGYQRIAVVCGAWHTPALVDLGSAKADAECLKDLPKIKVAATWIPWTYARLTYFSGYGAGIQSPGWYDHLWHAETDAAIRWLARVADLFRQHDLDASPAQVIDAVRLAEALAAIRNLPMPGLTELNEVSQSVFCLGSASPMQLIWRDLIVGDQLGDVPDDVPAVPLLQDFQREQKRLKLTEKDLLKRDAVRQKQKEAGKQQVRGQKDSNLELDLREPLDLDRSRFLHRLNMLDIAFAELIERNDSLLGTYDDESNLANKRRKTSGVERWQATWKPELAVELIEANQWGNTLYDAAVAYARGAGESAKDLPTLMRLLEDALLADLGEALDDLLDTVRERSTLTNDVAQLMDALTPLARLSRYGGVRQTDLSVAQEVTESVITRMCIGLGGACASLDDEAAEAMLKRIIKVNSAIRLLNAPEYRDMWQATLAKMADQRGLHGMITGRCARILHDAEVWPAAETARRLGLALSTANEPQSAAGWLEGFIRGGGDLLYHDKRLWQIVDTWVSTLHSAPFQSLLPLIRRTFSGFDVAIRERLMNRVLHGDAVSTQTVEYDSARGQSVLPTLEKLLGL
ncbi:MAG: DUF5682 family protein [Anaerolineae bacterium]